MQCKYSIRVVGRVPLTRHFSRFLQAECAQLQEEKEAVRSSAQSAEEALKRAVEAEGLARKGQLDSAHSELEQLRSRCASELEEIGRLRAKGLAESEEIGRLRAQLGAANTALGFAPEVDRKGDAGGFFGEGQQGFGGVTSGASLQPRYEGGDILSQLLSKPQPPSSGGLPHAVSTMTWQQELTRQQEPQAPLPFPEVTERPASSQMTWQQQEMTRQQEPHRAPPHHPGGHFAGHPRPPLLHETDLAFAHQQRQLAQQRYFQGGYFQGHPGPPSAPPFPRYPAANAPPFWDAPVMAGESQVQCVCLTCVLNLSQYYGRKLPIRREGEIIGDVLRLSFLLPESILLALLWKKAAALVCRH